MQFLATVFVIIATIFTGAFKSTAVKALRMSATAKHGTLMKSTSSKVQAIVGMLIVGGMITSSATPASAAAQQGGSFSKIVLPNKVEFIIGKADPNAVLGYTCPDDITKPAQVLVITSIAPRAQVK